MIRIGTLFSGGLGAPEQALKQMGWKHENVFACEWDKFARINHAANHHVPEGHFHIDINDMDGKQYAGKVDIIVGGSPCQDFSIAGLRAGVDGHRGQLIWQYFRIIDEVRPPVFIYENVKGMVSDKGGKTLKDFQEVFRDIGYHCHAEVLNTKDYGVPQNRERIYIVGFLDHNHYHRFEYAPKMKLEKRLKDVLESEVDEKYYIDHAKFNYDGGEQLNPKYESQGNTVYETDGTAPTLCAFTHGYALGYFKEPMIERWVNKRQGSVLDNIAPSLRASGGTDIRKCPRVHEAVMCASRGRNPQNPSDRTAGNHVEQRLEVNERGVSNALTTVQKDNYVLEPAQRIRKPTPREYFRLQGCDDTFKIAVSGSQAYKCAGNGMSVNILEMLFRQIKKAQSDEPTNTLMDFT